MEVQVNHPEGHATQSSKGTLVRSYHLCLAKVQMRIIRIIQEIIGSHESIRIRTGNGIIVSLIFTTGTKEGEKMITPEITIQDKVIDICILEKIHNLTRISISQGLMLRLYHSSNRKISICGKILFTA